MEEQGKEFVYEEEAASEAGEEGILRWYNRGREWRRDSWWEEKEVGRGRGAHDRRGTAGIGMGDRGNNFRVYVDAEPDGVASHRRWEPSIEEHLSWSQGRSQEGCSTNESATLKDHFLRGFQRRVVRRRVLHEVYGRPDNVEERRDRVRKCVQVPYSGSVCIVAAHGNHWHVVHDCAFAGGTCRCTRVRIFEELGGVAGRRYGRRSVLGTDYSVDHWVNTAIYLASGGRTIDHFSIGGRETSVGYGENGILSVRQGKERGSQELVAARFDQGTISRFWPCGPAVDPPAKGDRSGGQTYQDATGLQGGNQESKLLQLMKKFACAPLNHFYTTSHFINGPMRFVNTAGTYAENAMLLLKHEINQMSVLDLFRYQRAMDPPNLIYKAPYGNMSEYYYDLLFSVKVMDKLLSYQYPDNGDKESFLRDLLHVLDRALPKKNTLSVMGPAGSGKNYMMDACIHAMLNFGQIGNFNRFSNFPLQDAVDRRVLLWNEPNVEPAAYETLKEIFGGDSSNVKVKYKNDAILLRTPVIVLCNHEAFPTTEPFRQRMFRREWKACPALQTLTKKPFPFAIFYLLIKHNILMVDRELFGKFSNYELQCVQ
uniref:Putative nonstructural protein 1 n=1 Tax=Tarsiger cyanurus ambidensovirus TaxID=2794449 RepID=A0A8A4XE80_9VIRU|nr:MAG: putative nonstructural protein 1 [Tarsiger cyanurus ambidensovirus]